jgi:hypothetical protein
MLDFLAERKIQEALAGGEFDELPGAGRPLDLSDDALIPEELRLAYRILKNAGYVPEEVQALKEIEQLEALVAGDKTDTAARARAVRKLALLKARIEGSYYLKALARLGR